MKLIIEIEFPEDADPITTKIIDELDEHLGDYLLEVYEYPNSINIEIIK